MIAGRYRLERVLGRGGFAITYLATDRRGANVVVKELAPPGCRRSGLAIHLEGPDNGEMVSKAREQTLKEAQILKDFNDPRVVKVSDLREANETVYVVMEYLHGSDLEAYAQERGGRLPHEEVASVLKEILQGLARVHSSEILHRDVKPSNVMLTTDGRIVLIDFGAARAITDSPLTTMLQMLTPQYAALEQISGGRKTAATDLFAVGGIGWRLLTGAPPPDVVRRREGTRLPRLQAGDSAYLTETIEWALSIDAVARPQSAGEMLRGLEGRGADRGADWTRTRVTPRAPRRGRRRASAPRSTRARAQPSGEAQRLAAAARWPLAALAAAPALIVPLPMAIVYLGAVLARTLLLRGRAAARRERDAAPLTPARLVFQIPRILIRLLGHAFGWLGSTLGFLVRVAFYVGIGALIAASCAAAITLVKNGHFDSAAFLEQFNATFPRTAVTLPIFLTVHKLADGALARRVVQRVTAMSETAIVGLWGCGVVLPLVLALTFTLRPWAPFRSGEQGLSWLEEQLPLVAYIDNAIARAWIHYQVGAVLHCRELSRRYRLTVSDIGRRSFTVTIDLDRELVERDAARMASAGGSNAGWQVGLATAVLGGLDHSLITRVRAITVREGTLPPAGSQFHDVVLELHLSRPHGGVLHEGASIQRAIRAARISIADPTRSEALERLLPNADARAADALCG
jgi:tRNA A-37 threonylcarbamoyl transferase component Bud32